MENLYARSRGPRGVRWIRASGLLGGGLIVSKVYNSFVK